MEPFEKANRFRENWGSL